MVTAVFLLLTGIQSPADLPPIGIIDFYGLRQVSPQQVEQALQVKPGDRVDREAIQQAERRLPEIPGVEAARLNVVMMTGKTILFVGIQEKGAPALRFRPAPEGAAKLPEDVLRDGRAFEEALMEAVEKGDAEDDLSQGYSMMHYSAARAIQQRFVNYAARDLAVLREVLRDSKLPEHRALAAQIIAYAPDRRGAARELESTMLDPEPDVRNNAMRALAIIALYARQHPERKIRVHPHAFVALLNSLVWTDRNKASFALLALTESRDPALLKELRREALPALMEMARWKSTGHAWAPFLVLGRVAGLPEKTIQDAWDRGDRDAVIAAAR